ncbi:9501_t:CDS:2, partial [Cetraspora pellucida]
MSYENNVSICSEHPTEENEVHELDSRIRTLREMVQKSREKTKVLSSKIDTQDEEGQNFQYQMTKPRIKYDSRAMENHILDFSSSEDPFLNTLLAKAQKYLLPSSAYERHLQVLWDKFATF